MKKLGLDHLYPQDIGWKAQNTCIFHMASSKRGIENFSLMA